MRWPTRRRPRVSVVVPVYDVEAYLPRCLDSVLAQDHPDLEVVVVDDGSPDGSGAIADDYAARDPRVRVVHIANRGLGAARNEGLRHATGDLLAFADSDDVVPPGAYTSLVRQQARTGSDLVVGSVARWFAGPSGDHDAPDARLVQPPWLRRIHAERRVAVVEQVPEVLGDVFAWNKLFRREFWDDAGLAWAEGTRYEDQPTTTEAYLRARRIGIVTDVVYHWRVRHDGSSITQQRSSLEDLRDRWATKRTTRRLVLDYGSKPVTDVFSDRVLPGDLPRYFASIPGCSDEWYALLEAGVREFFGTRSITRSFLPPVHRLTGWLVENGRRDEAEAVMTYVAGLPPGERPARVADRRGPRIDVPGVDFTTVARDALALRPGEE